jgi:hypothetical protein
MDAGGSKSGEVTVRHLTPESASDERCSQRHSTYLRLSSGPLALFRRTVYAACGTWINNSRAGTGPPYVCPTEGRGATTSLYSALGDDAQVPTRSRGHKPINGPFNHLAITTQFLGHMTCTHARHGYLTAHRNICIGSSFFHFLNCKRELKGGHNYPIRKL